MTLVVVEGKPLFKYISDDPTCAATKLLLKENRYSSTLNDYQQEREKLLLLKENRYSSTFCGVEQWLEDKLLLKENRYSSTFLNRAAQDRLRCC